VQCPAARAGPARQVWFHLRTGGLGPQDPPTRERRVLRALSGPITLREIADELFVSHNTVKTQVRAIFHKLDAHDRSVAVARARAHGVL
jgi:LuxR family maltose regulon positive regulatory protein